MYKVYLKPGKEESLRRFHPWVFSGAIARMDGWKYIPPKKNSSPKVTSR